jgi:hypothetical protein
MKRALLALCVVLLAPTQALAQRSPELQALDRLVGEWTYDQMEGGGACEWIGESFVVCISRWTDASGAARANSWVNGYDAAAKVYTTWRFNDNGYRDSGFGWRTGDNTWTWVFDSTAGRKLRFTAEFPSETVYTYKWARSVEGGAWEDTSAGSMTKVR